jgi:hypothetical protein
MSNLRYILLLSVVGLMMGGCAADRTADTLMACQNENIALSDQNARLTKELTQAKQTEQKQTEQIENLARLGPGRLENLTRAEKIELDRQTGGYDENGDKFDDGIAVYLSPRDAGNHIIKAAGELRIRLYELHREPKLIGECFLDAKTLNSKWVARFLANHYSVRCPFTKKPTDRNITVQVEFVELLTGKPFVAQKLVEIKLPTAATSTSPAR